MGKSMPEDMAKRGQQAPTHVAPKDRSEQEAALREQERRLQESAVLRSVSVNQLRPNPHQPEERSRRGIADLAESLRVHGLIHPPLVRRSETGGYEIVTGHRRVEAWRVLVARGVRNRNIRVFVAEIGDDDVVFLALAEGAHREDFSAVEDAEFVDKVRRARARQLGREPTVRDLADVIPTDHGRTAVAEALVIARALEDDRIGHLVRQADGIGKSLLYNVLRHDDFQTRHAALRVAADGGDAKEVQAALRPKRSGRPPATVTKKKRGERGYDLSVRVRAKMAEDEIDRAIEALEAAVADLKDRRAGMDS